MIWPTLEEKAQEAANEICALVRRAFNDGYNKGWDDAIAFTERRVEETARKLREANHD